MQYPGLLPFAVLTNTNTPVETLKQVAQEISNISDQQTQNNVAASAFILAGLVLEQNIIQQLLWREIMRESVTYQAILDEGRADGIQEGIRLVAVNLLREGTSIETVAKVTGLTVEQVQQLEITNSENTEE